MARIEYEYAETTDITVNHDKQNNDRSSRINSLDGSMKNTIELEYNGISIAIRKNYDDTTKETSYSLNGVKERLVICCQERLN